MVCLSAPYIFYLTQKEVLKENVHLVKSLKYTST
jgi:hypothetical protein